ncbi:MAG: hypothetical protein R3E31_20400 [Chloroflexota bacterium]
MNVICSIGFLSQYVKKTVVPTAVFRILSRMAKIKNGTIAPDVHLQTLQGESVKLAETWQNGRSALLIFLRHLA